MDTFLIKAAQLILALAILVIIHEFGHFLFARLFGVRVNKFYMFFNPWTTLVKWRPGKYFGAFGRTRHYDPELEKEHQEICRLEKEAADSKDEAKISAAYDRRAAFEDKYYYTDGKAGKSKRRFWKETEYGLGWLPLGGYCQIAGMIDESMNTEQMKREPQKWEFRSKPAWQRLLIMIAGVLFNFLLAILIYAGIVYATGEKYVPFSEAKMGMSWSGEAQKVGFRDGDIPLYADGKALDNPGEARMEIAQASNVTVLRGNDTVDIAIPEKFLFNLDAEAKSDTALFSLMTYRIPAEVSMVQKGDGADKAGIMKGDRLIAIDSLPTPTIMSFLKTLEGHEGKTVAITYTRGNDTIVTDVKLSDASKMGIGLVTDPSEFFKTKEIHYNIFQSVPRGIEIGTDRLVSYGKSMKMIFTKEGAKSVGGFGTIGSIFPEKWDWIAFWNIAAFLSVALAFMNILPIPALDGGHVLFLLYEVIFRRKPSEKFLERAQMIGIFLLLALLIYANGMDIVRLFK